MNRREVMEQSIIDALREIGPATARQVESHPPVALACRQAKLKARHRLESLMLAGRVQSDRAGQGATFWVSVEVEVVKSNQPTIPASREKWTKGGGLPSLKNFREMAAEFDVALDKLRYAMRDENSPKAKFVHQAPNVCQNSWYNPDDMRRWWEGRQQD